MRAFWQRLDGFVARLERLVVVGSLATMVGLVCVAVLADLFNHDSKWLPLLQQAFSTGAKERTLLNNVGHTLSAVGWTFLCCLAVRTRLPHAPLGTSVLRGLAIALLSIGCGLLCSWVLPHGLAFSQKLSLGLFMWVVLLGASLATFERRHIALQALQKAIKPEHLPVQAALGSFCAAAFSLFLVVPCTTYTIERYRTWIETEMAGAVIDSLPIVPLWTITISFPLGFALIGVRFASQGVLILRRDIAAVPVQESLSVSAGDEGAAASRGDEL